MRLPATASFRGRNRGPPGRQRSEVQDVELCFPLSQIECGPAVGSCARKVDSGLRDARGGRKDESDADSESGRRQDSSGARGTVEVSGQVRKFAKRNS